MHRFLGRCFGSRAALGWAAGLLFCYFLGVFAGKAMFDAAAQGTQRELGQAVSLFISLPRGSLAIGWRPGVWQAVWVVGLSLAAVGIIGLPPLFVLRGMSTGQLLGAMMACGLRGKVWSAGFLLPIDLLWVLPLVCLGVRAAGNQWHMMRTPAAAWRDPLVRRGIWKDHAMGMVRGLGLLGAGMVAATLWARAWVAIFT